MTYPEIATFWLSHPEFWITPPHMTAQVDAELLRRFGAADLSHATLLDCVIYVDQLGRHFCRAGALSESSLASARTAIVEELKGGMDELLEAQEDELIWYLMPFKHVHEYDPVFQTIRSWLLLRGGVLTDYRRLHRFFADTFRKATTAPLPTLATPVALDDASAATVCENYPRGDWGTGDMPAAARALCEVLPRGKVAVSLSGGVDSMLMCALLRRCGADVIAIHIIYGNRDVSDLEYAVITSYCARLGVPLWKYEIPHIRRGDVDRDFYESETRRLRFGAYRALGRPVLLGHIYDDVVENVWTNFATGKHLDDLVKMKASCIEDDVTVLRPWLGVRKSVVYEVARALEIPWLLNTTPAWSNRGKFRTTFYAATHAQYGATVDDVIVDAACRLASQAVLLERVLYAPMFATWCDATRSMDVSAAVESTLDAGGWEKVLRWIAYKCGLAKPSISACRDFARRAIRDGARMTLHKTFDVMMKRDGTRWRMYVL